MPFCDLLGNSQVVSRLERLLASKKIPSTFLFAGPKGVGKMLFAKAFAAHLLGEKHHEKVEKGIHPDVHIYVPEGKAHVHSMASMKEFIHEMQMPPYEAVSKVMIIDDFECMLASSSNALLKSLEEPLENTYIIAITPSPESLLSTILSRMHRVNFSPLTDKDIVPMITARGIDKEIAEKMAFLSNGSVGKAFFMIEHPTLISKGKIQDLYTSFWEGEYQKFLQIAAELEKEIESLEEEGLIRMATDLLLEQILYYFRDIHHLSVGIEPFFFDRERDFLKKCCEKHLPPLDVCTTWIDEARNSLQANIKLRTALENVFLRFLQVRSAV